MAAGEVKVGWVYDQAHRRLPLSEESEGVYPSSFEQTLLLISFESWIAWTIGRRCFEYRCRCWRR